MNNHERKANKEKEDFAVQCAWCGKIKHKGSSEKISHGICQECSDKEEKKMTK